MIKQDGNTLDIAFASSNETDLDEHFGSCQQLVIYRLSIKDKEHINSVKFSFYEGHNQKKISERLDALTNCFAVYCLACGNPVRKQLLNHGVRVVIHPQVESIDNLITQIQSNWPGKIALRQERRVKQKKDIEYFNKLADSEWD